MAYGFVYTPNDAGVAGCVITITFEAAFEGKTYTITDGNGDMRSGIVPPSHTATVRMKNCNTTYTVTANVDGIPYSNTVTTGAYFGQYSVTLSVFTATIAVTAVAGAVVTATCGSRLYSATAASDGVATITVKRSGTYTVSGTFANASSNSASVNVTTNGASYTVAIQFITLTLTSPSGSEITVSKGSTSLTGTSTGGNVFYLPSTGTWTVTITKSGETATGSVSATAYQSYSLELAYVHIYGASWDGTSTTSWTRTDDAAGFTDPVPYVAGATEYGSPFDTLQPWAGMVKSERTGGTMVSIPKFWYKLTQDGAEMKIQIADKAVEGFSVSPAHIDRGDGKGERDVVYIGRYHCSSNYKSTTGEKPKTAISRSVFRTGIHKLGTNIWQADLALRFTLWLLYLVEFADWNSQAKVGYGCGNGSNSNDIMGYTDSMPYHTGTTKSSRTTYGVGIQYRYIEGLWDNALDWCDGCYMGYGGLHIILNPENFSDGDNGVCVGLTSMSGVPSAFTVTNEAGFPLFLPTNSVTGTNKTTYMCDTWGIQNTGASSTPCICVGAYYSRAADYGLFCVWAFGINSYSSTGSRLMELP